MSEPAKTAEELLAQAKVRRVTPITFGKWDEATRHEYLRQDLVNQLENERNRLLVQVADVPRLHAIEVDHARLIQARKRQRTTDGVTAIVMVLGSCLISGFSLPDGPGWGPFAGNQLYAMGWAFVLIAGLIQLVRSVFDG